MSFKEASEHTGIDFHQMARNDILPIIEMTLISARLKLNKGNRRFCFEIYGYDFMLDEQNKPWLIEVNTNPCLEESSGLLKQLIPRLLDDAFKLTLDVLYPPLYNIKPLQENDENDEKVQKSVSVEGYPDSQNLWGEPFYQFRLC